MERDNTIKILQSLYYIQKKLGNTKQPYMKLLKLLYFADRYNVRTWGATITGDTYFAMKHGAVPSTAKDILTKSDYIEDKIVETDVFFDGKNVQIKEQNDDFLSETDKESLDFAINTFGEFDQFELAEITHDYPEWKNQEQTLHFSQRSVMNLGDFCDDPTETKYINKHFSKDPYKLENDIEKKMLKLFQKAIVNHTTIWAFDDDVN